MDDDDDDDTKGPMKESRSKAVMAIRKELEAARLGQAEAQAKLDYAVAKVLSLETTLQAVLKALERKPKAAKPTPRARAKDLLDKIDKEPGRAQELAKEFVGQPA